MAISDRIIDRKDNSTIVIDHVNISFSIMDRTTSQKINNLNTINQLDYIILHAATAKYIFSSAHDMLLKTDRETSLNMFKKTEIIHNMSSEQNGKILKVNNKKKSEQVTNMWRLNNTLLNNQ